MASIHEEENRILKELSQNCPSWIDKDKLVPDGLHYLGKVSSEGGYWEREPGDEEQKWRELCKQKRGLVVLTKDLNDTQVWDIRMELGRDNNNPDINNPTPSTTKFYENLRRWRYGIMTMSESGEMPEYPTTEEAQEHFVEQPWVRMNLKKERGKEGLKDDVLDAHIAASKEYLQKQLKLYEGASIYLDCAKSRSIELLKQIWPDITPFSFEGKPRIYYSEERRFIIIDSHHPSAWEYDNMRQRISEEDYYNEMRKAVQAFFKEHPNFLQTKKDERE